MKSVTVPPLALLLLACAPASPEARIRKAFATAVQAVEAGDASAAVAVLDEGFQGPDGMNRAEARGYLYGWLRREKVGITVLAQKIEVRGNQALQVADLLLTGRSGSGLLPQDSSRRSLQVRWVLVGGTWKIREIRTDGA